MNPLKLFLRKDPKTTGLRMPEMVPTSQVWRQSPQAVETALAWLNHPSTKTVLAMLANESPVRTGQFPMGMRQEDCLRQLGREEGWQAAIAYMISLGILEKGKVELEETYIEQL